MLKFLLILNLFLAFSAIAQETSTPTITLDDTIETGINKIVERAKDTKGKIAIMDFPGLDGRMTGLSAYINNKVGNRFIFAGRQVVDRSTLEKVIDEQKLQQNALVDATTAARVGKLAGAGVFIIGSYVKTDNKFSLTIRALSVESGQFIPGGVSEDTLMNFGESYAKELNDLISMRVTQKEGTTSAQSSSADTSIGKSDTSMSKAELEFNKKVCGSVQKDNRLAKIVKTAFETNYLSIEELKSIESNGQIQDLSGESNSGYYVGAWAFNTRGPCPFLVGNFIKGKNLNFCNFDEWLYKGQPFPGIEKCIKKLDWWTGKK